MATYKDPWADTANQAVGALFKYYLSQPNAAEVQAGRLKSELLNAQIANERSNTELNRRRLDSANNIADVVNNFYAPVEAEGPVQPGMQRPTAPASQEMINDRIRQGRGDLMRSAANFSIASPSAFSDVLGGFYSGAGAPEDMTAFMQDQGDLSAPVKNFNFRRTLDDTQDQQLFDSYVRANQKLDLGDTQVLASGATGLPVQNYGVGFEPKTEIQDGRVVRVQGVANPNRPVTGDDGRFVVASLAEQAGVNPNLADRVFGAESNFGQNQGPSTAGAIGPMQTMPGTLRDPGYGVEPARDNSQMEQTRVGVDYLAAMMNRYQGDEEAALIAYNWGPARADDWIAQGRNPEALPDETRDYLQKILGGGQDGIMIQNLPKTAEDIERENNRDFASRRRMDDLDNTFASAIFNIGKGGAGLWSFKKDIPFVGGQTSAGTLEADIARLTASAAIDEIARLKQESKTGGFFGNLSDGERQAVADAQAAIRQDLEPKELAYRLMVFQDLKNDIIHGRGKINPQTGETIPIDLGTPRTGMPTAIDIQRAQSPDELKQMWDAFNQYDVFEGEPPAFIVDAMVKRMNDLRGQ